MEIQTFHRYNRLVRRGFAKPLVCSHCFEEYTLRTTEDGDPVLQCAFCNIMVQPGLNIYNTVRAVVKEHYDN
jgi:uncharacterized protein (DUF983 family)